MTRILGGLALLALSACAGDPYCTTAQAMALGLDLGGSWASEAHYEDAAEVCAASDLTFQASPADPRP